METIFSLFYFFIFFVLWAYFFIYAYRNNVSLPWGFSIVIMGNLVANFNFDFSLVSGKLFSINAVLIISLIGVLLNINNIRKQILVTDNKIFFRFIIIGSVLGLLAGYFSLMIARQTVSAQHVQVDSQLTAFILIIRTIQQSIAEEFIFRGYLLSYLSKFKFNQVVAIMFQALIFSLGHVLRYENNWIMLCWILVYGVVAGYITSKSKNLIPACIFHVINNLVVGI